MASNNVQRLKAENYAGFKSAEALVESQDDLTDVPLFKSLTSFSKNDVANVATDNGETKSAPIKASVEPTGDVTFKVNVVPLSKIAFDEKLIEAAKQVASPSYDGEPTCKSFYWRTSSLKLYNDFAMTARTDAVFLGIIGSSGVLTVGIIEAKNLRGPENNSIDPFVKVVRGKKVLFKSHVMKRNLNPSWNESFTMGIEGGPEPIQIGFQVNHNTMLSSLVLDSVDVNLWDEIELAGSKDMSDGVIIIDKWFSMDASHGELHLSLMFRPGPLSASGTRASSDNSRSRTSSSDHSLSIRKFSMRLSKSTEKILMESENE